MEPEVNEIINGFAVKAIKEIPDCAGTLYEMEHLKTGARLCWLRRFDDNKTFAITFKTIPENDTGVFHIIEHTVLNGSAKYPVKEPFVELLKSSMQTFLNAITFPDRTMFPVSSRNEKDFMNLMSVYLDAVFRPAIYHNPNIFYQEGWHYEIHDMAEEPSYNGVVYNEMKGAFAGSDETIVDEFNRMLFPDNCYRFVFGGDPAHIPELSYDAFTATHARFYHPSNAYVFLDGDIDIVSVTAFIDEEYFAHYEKEEIAFDIAEQVPVKGRNSSVPYEISPQENPEGKNHIVFGKIIASFDETEKIIGWDALSDVLTETNEAPLKKALLEADLAEDLNIVLYDGIKQPWLMIETVNSPEKDAAKIREVLKNTCAGMIEEGLDKEQIKATLNRMEFQYYEKHEPAGVIYAQRVNEAWLYGGDPSSPLSIGSVFAALREKADEGFFEKLLAEFIDDDERLCSVTALADPKLGERKAQEEAARLKAARASWESAETYVKLNAGLEAWQAADDSEEDLAKLPRLNLNDVDEDPGDYPFTLLKHDDVSMLVYPEADNGIVYVNFYFNMAGLTRDMLPRAGLWSSLLTELRTRSKTLTELSTAIKRDTGSLHFFLDCYTPLADKNVCIPVTGLSLSCRKENLAKALALAGEIMKETEFDGDKILELLKQDNEEFRQGLIMSGHTAAMRRGFAHFNSEGVFREYVGGYASGLYEKKLEENWEKEKNELINDCELLSETIFAKKRVTVSFTGEANADTVTFFLDGLSQVDAQKAGVRYPLLADMKEAIAIPAGIGYACGCSSLLLSDRIYEPTMAVMAHILTYGKLWNEIRVKGGAYGTGYMVNVNGCYGGYSFRDPSPLNSLEIMASAGEYIRELAEDDLCDYIIATIASGDPLLTPAAKIKIADTRFFTGLTYEMRKENREALLTLTLPQLRQLGGLIEADEDKTAKVVVAPLPAVREAEKEGFKLLEAVV